MGSVSNVRALKKNGGVGGGAGNVSGVSKKRWRGYLAGGGGMGRRQRG